MFSKMSFKWFVGTCWFAYVCLSGIYSVVAADEKPGKKDAEATSTAPDKIYFTPPQNISLAWTFESSFSPLIVYFTRYDPSLEVYDGIVYHIVPRKQTIVFLAEDRKRMDMNGVAVLRINNTVAADARKYKCRITTTTGERFESIKELIVRGKVEAMCEKAIKPAGCFNDSVTDRALGNFLTSYRPSLQNDGITVDWNNYQVSLNRMLCDCASRAKAANYKYFGIQYYGECWAGNNADFNKHGTSKECIDGKFKECSIAKDAACTGKTRTIYIYELQ